MESGTDAKKTRVADIAETQIIKSEGTVVKKRYLYAPGPTLPGIPATVDWVTDTPGGQVTYWTRRVNQLARVPSFY